MTNATSFLYVDEEVASEKRNLGKVERRAKIRFNGTPYIMGEAFMLETPVPAAPIPDEMADEDDLDLKDAKAALAHPDNAKPIPWSEAKKQLGID